MPVRIDLATFERLGADAKAKIRDFLTEEVADPTEEVADPTAAATPTPTPTPKVRAVLATPLRPRRPRGAGPVAPPPVTPPKVDLPAAAPVAPQAQFCSVDDAEVVRGPKHAARGVYEGATPRSAGKIGKWRWIAGGATALVLAAVLIHPSRSRAPVAAPNPDVVRNVRCLVAGQVALERTAADCTALQKATAASAKATKTTKTTAAKAMPQVVTRAPKPTAPAQAAPQQPARTAARKTVAPAPQPKAIAQQPAKAAAPAPKPAARPVPTPAPAKRPAQPAPSALSSSGGRIDGLPSGFHAYLCRVEHRTDGFCQGG